MGKIRSYALGILLAFLALNAIGGGYYGMAGAKAVPVALLKGSPFKDYFIPSLFLFVVVGGSALFASIAVFRRMAIAKKAAMISAIIVIIWLAVQVGIIGYISWMQPLTALVAVIIFILSLKLPHNAH